MMVHESKHFLKLLQIIGTYNRSVTTKASFCESVVFPILFFFNSTSAHILSFEFHEVRLLENIGKLYVSMAGVIGLIKKHQNIKFVVSFPMKRVFS